MQSLVAHGRVKKQQQNGMRLNELTDGEMRVFRGMAFQIYGAAQLKAQRPIAVSTEGFASWCISCD